MVTQHARWQQALGAAVIALGLVAGLAIPAQSGQAAPAVDPSFAHYYATHQGARLLGQPIAERQGSVQYFEKGRLEDHRGRGLPPAWEFMFGRLGAELIEAAVPLPVAGESGPTYAMLRELTGPTRRIAPPASVDGVQPSAGGVFVPFDPALRPAPGYEVPAVFWAYLTRADLFPGGWLHDVGLPLTPAFTAEVRKGDRPRLVTIQAFERTILTYDPANPLAWQVERANIGTHALAPRPPESAPGPPAPPPGWRGEYFDNAELDGPPVLVRYDARIDFDWGSRAPAAGLPDDYFSVRWTRALTVSEAGGFRVTVRADDGVRVWVAGRRIVDQWSSVQRTDGYIYLEEGPHLLRVEYRELTGSAGIDLSLERIDRYPDWQGAYYDSDDLEATPAFWRNDKQLDFDWGEDGPGSGLRRNDFSVRWTRQHDFVAGRYRFTVTADDGVRLSVDGVKLLDRWDRRGDATTYTVDLSVKAGKRTIQLDYRDQDGPAEVRVSYGRIS